MEKLKIGWSEADITPEKRVRLAGQFFERISEYVETPVTVTALAIESGDEQAVLCACDLLEIGSSLLENVREKIKDKKLIFRRKSLSSARFIRTPPYSTANGVICLPVPSGCLSGIFRMTSGMWSG